MRLEANNNLLTKKVVFTPPVITNILRAYLFCSFFHISFFKQALLVALTYFWLVMWLSFALYSKLNSNELSPAGLSILTHLPFVIYKLIHFC